MVIRLPETVDDMRAMLDDGLIRDFTVMVRPRSAAEALLVAVGSRLAAAR